MYPVFWCRKAWSPELTSQSPPVSCFWSRGFVPHRKSNFTLLVYQNTGKENRYRTFFFAMHTSTLRTFNRTNKKNLSYNFGMSRKPQDSSRLPLVNFSRCRHHRYPLGNTKVDGNTTTKFINFATVVFALLYMFVVLAVFSLIFPKWQPTKRTCGIINFRTKTSFVFLVLVGELVDFEKACSFLNRVCDWLSKQ